MRPDAGSTTNLCNDFHMRKYSERGHRASCCKQNIYDSVAVARRLPLCSGNAYVTKRDDPHFLHLALAGHSCNASNRPRYGKFASVASSHDSFIAGPPPTVE